MTNSNAEDVDEVKSRSAKTLTQKPQPVKGKKTNVIIVVSGLTQESSAQPRRQNATYVNRQDTTEAQKCVEVKQRGTILL